MYMPAEVYIIIYKIGIRSLSPRGRSPIGSQAMIHSKIGLEFACCYTCCYNMPSFGRIGESLFAQAIQFLMELQNH